MKATKAKGKDCDKHFQDSFFVNEKNCGIFMGSTEILEKVDKVVIRRMHYDGTFFSAPRPFYQVLTVMAESFARGTLSWQQLSLLSRLSQFSRNLAK